MSILTQKRNKRLIRFPGEGIEIPARKITARLARGNVLLSQGHYLSREEQDRLREHFRKNPFWEN